MDMIFFFIVCIINILIFVVFTHFKESLTSSHSNQLQQQSTPSNRHTVKHGSNAPTISVMQPTPRTNLANQAPQEQVQQSQGGYYNNNQQRQSYNSGSFNGNQQTSQGQHNDHDQHRPPAQNAPFYSSQYGQQSYNHSNNNNNSGHYTVSTFSHLFLH